MKKISSQRHMSDKKENRLIQNPLMMKKNRDDSKSTGDNKENKGESKQESNRQRVVEFEKTWNDFEELKKKIPKENKYIKYWTRVFEKVDKRRRI
jgi:hypothetical protein